jgi:hypothetical protein
MGLVGSRALGKSVMSSGTGTPSLNPSPLRGEGKIPGKGTLAAAPVIYQAQRGGQERFLAEGGFEALFGGAAGPGKTWALAYDALGIQYRGTKLGKAAVEVPEYRGVLFRRYASNLADLIDECHGLYVNETWGARCVLGGKGDPGVVFIFPKYYQKGGVSHKDRGGARIFLSHLATIADIHKHQGFEYQYVGFDELTQFLLRQYLYLMSRMRTKVDGLFPRIRGTTNPVGEGLAWVRKRFITGSTPNVRSYFIADKDPERNPRGLEVVANHPDARSRIFIPGVLAENKYIDKAAYAGNIRQMGQAYTAALLDGDWDAFGGDFFKSFKRSMVIKPFEVPAGWLLVGSIDPGWSSPCSFSLRARDYEGNVYRLCTYYERERSAPEHAKEIKKFIENFKWTRGRMPSLIVSGADAWQHKDRYAAVGNEFTFADHFAAEGLILQPAMTERILGWWGMKNLMDEEKYWVFEGFNEPFMDELSAAISDEKRPEDILGGGNNPDVVDHALDEDRYGVAAVYTPRKRETGPKGWEENFLKYAKAREGKGWLGS